MFFSECRVCGSSEGRVRCADDTDNDDDDDDEPAAESTTGDIADNATAVVDATGNLQQCCSVKISVRHKCRWRCVSTSQVDSLDSLLSEERDGTRDNLSAEPDGFPVDLSAERDRTSVDLSVESVRASANLSAERDRPSVDLSAESVTALVNLSAEPVAALSDVYAEPVTASVNLLAAPDGAPAGRREPDKPSFSCLLNRNRTGDDLKDKHNYTQAIWQLTVWRWYSSSNSSSRT